jgi:signal transduction histidine kinase
VFRKLSSRRLLTDLAIAAVFLLLSLLNTWSGSGPVDVAALVVFSLALALRRISPALALIVAWAGALVQLSTGLLVAAGPLSGVMGRPTVPAFSDLAILAVLFATAAYGGRRVRWLGLASALFGAFLATAYIVLSPLASVGDAIGNTAPLVHGAVIILFGCLAALGLSWTLGQLTRTWRRARDSRVAQAAAENDVVVEQERNRIARDMHDVVAHSLAVVIAQADGARYARSSDPGAVDDALTTISTIAREALGDVRILLTQLRHSQGEVPQPVLGDINTLVDQMSAAGLVVHRTDSGEAPELPSGQQLAVFRIVQEALTNALRPGDTSQPVSIHFDWSGQTTVTVTNAIEERTPDANSAGHGLAGMRERALLAGGSLTATVAGEQWIVYATIPMQPAVAVSS